MIKINRERIDEFLKFRRWNRSDFAKALSFSEAYITYLLNEEREPSAEFMERLVRLTGLSFNDLFFCSNNPINVANQCIKSQKGNNNAQPNQENPNSPLKSQ